MNKCILVTHGDLGQALLNTNEKIIGPQEGIKVISNEHTSLKDLIATLETAIQEWKDDDILIMVDFCGGSCWHAAQVISRDKSNIALLSGVNLPIMLTYVNRRDSFRLPELADFLRESSIKGTSVVKGSADKPPPGEKDVES